MLDISLKYEIYFMFSIPWQSCDVNMKAVSILLIYVPYRSIMDEITEVGE